MNERVAPNARRSSLPILLAACLVACTDPWMEPERMVGGTEVVVFPVPRGPNRPPAIGPEEVEALVRAAQPDVIFVEVPPDKLPAAVGAAESGAKDPWLTHLPDVRRVLAFAGRASIPVEPISAWTPEVGRDWRAFIGRGLPADELYRRARDYRLRRDAESGDEPEWVLSTARSELVEWEASTLESAVPVHLGSAAPSRLGQALARRVQAALEEHHGERVAIVIDAKFALRVERAASATGPVRIIDPRAFMDALDELEERARGE